MPSIALPVSLRGQLLSGTRTFSPASLFSANEPGVWFDPSDLTTLFTDPAGTTPVTAPGNTVGLMLDKSKGLALGPELVANGDFANGSTGWTLGALWTVSDAQLVGSNVASGTYATSSSFTVVTGTFYRVSLTTTVTSGSFSVRFDNGGTETVLGTVSTSGSHTFYVAAPDASSVVGLRALASGFTGTVDNISVRELAGNHATQATLAARPTYSIEPVGGRRNLLTWSEGFDNAAWTKSNATASAGTITATASSGFHCVTQAATTSGSFVVASVRAKPGTSNFVWITATPSFGGANYATAVANLATGEVTKTQSGGTLTGATAAISGLDAQGFYRVTLSAANPTSAMTEVIGVSNSATPTITSYGSVEFAASGTESIITGGAQFETGSTATAYQRVTTQHDVTEAGVASLSYLYFDGVNDAMVTSTITPGTDKVQVFTGVRKLVDSAGYQIIAELSTDVGSAGNPGSFVLAPATGTHEFFSKGTAVISAVASGYAAPITNVVTGLGDISGDRTTIRMNSAQITQSTGDQGAGNYLAYPLYIGARAGASLFFNGRLYSLITRFGANLDTPSITSTEIWVGDKTGIDVAKNISTTIYTRSGDTILDRANSTIERRAV